MAPGRVYLDCFGRRIYITVRERWTFQGRVPIDDRAWCWAPANWSYLELLRFFRACESGAMWWGGVLFFFFFNLLLSLLLLGTIRHSGALMLVRATTFRRLEHPMPSSNRSRPVPVTIYLLVQHREVHRPRLHRAYAKFCVGKCCSTRHRSIAIACVTRVQIDATSMERPSN